MRRFWDWSGTVYQREGVKEALLALQDQYRLDVNSILFCFWCAHGGIHISSSVAEEMSELIDNWAIPHVSALRAARRSLSTSAVLTQSRAQVLKAQLLSIELDLEEVHQDALQELVDPIMRFANQSSTNAEILAQRNLQEYFAAHSETGARQEQLLSLPFWNTLNRLVLTGQD